MAPPIRAVERRGRPLGQGVVKPSHIPLIVADACVTIGSKDARPESEVRLLCDFHMTTSISRSTRRRGCSAINAASIDLASK